jgi:hypothetical protein
VGIARCYQCWSCPGGGLGCMGDCSHPCPTCFEVDPGPGTTDILKIYNFDGTLLDTKTILKGWTTDNVTDDGGHIIIEIHYTEQQ